MRIGASTASLYPAPVEDALDTLLQMGIRVVEVFFNTPSEETPAFVRMLRKKADAAGACITAVHPHLSLAEPFCLFSQYERRFRDALSDYRRLFEATAALGAHYLVLHGDRADDPPLPPEAFAARYAALYDTGQTCGVTLLQENVVRFRAQSPDFVRQMRALLGEQAQFVLDVKQCRRAGVPVADMIGAMRGALRHLHLSDAAPGHDCLLPGAGEVDFAALFAQLRAAGFDGDGVVELYRDNFGDAAQLRQGCDTLAALL